MIVLIVNALAVSCILPWCFCCLVLLECFLYLIGCLLIYFWICGVDLVMLFFRVCCWIYICFVFGWFGNVVLTCVLIVLLVSFVLLVCGVSLFDLFWLFYFYLGVLYCGLLDWLGLLVLNVGLFACYGVALDCLVRLLGWVV